MSTTTSAYRVRTFATAEEGEATRWLNKCCEDGYEVDRMDMTSGGPDGGYFICVVMRMRELDEPSPMVQQVMERFNAALAEKLAQEARE